MSTHLYTMVEGMRGVQGFLENSKSFLYILVHRLVHRIVGCSRIFMNCKEPSKVLESSISAYK